MGRPKRLTEMQKRFCQYLVFGGPDGPVNKMEAAELAGYSPKRCRQEGSELTNPRKFPLVVRYIQELQGEVQQKYDVTFERHIRKLAEIRDQAIDKGNLTAAVSAEVQRGRAAGIYVERKEIRTGTLESLSEKQHKQKIDSLLADYQPLLEAEEAEFEEL